MKRIDIDPELINSEQKYLKNLKNGDERYKIAQSINSDEGFISWVNDLYYCKKDDENNRERFMRLETAYEKTEALFYAIFGRRMYGSFDSFRVTRSQLSKHKKM